MFSAREQEPPYSYQRGVRKCWPEFQTEILGLKSSHIILFSKILLTNDFVSVTIDLNLSNGKCLIMVICKKREVLKKKNHSYAAGLKASNEKFCFTFILKCVLPGRKYETYAWPASMHLQSSNRCHQHNRIRHQARCSALDIEKFLHSNISTKASFSYCGESRWKLVIIFSKQEQVLAIVGTTQVQSEV